MKVHGAAVPVPLWVSQLLARQLGNVWGGNRTADRCSAANDGWCRIPRCRLRRRHVERSAVTIEAVCPPKGVLSVVEAVNLRGCAFLQFHQ